MIKRQNKVISTVASVIFVGSTILTTTNALANEYTTVNMIENGRATNQMAVKVNDLSVRSGSSTKHNKIGVLNKGDVVTVVSTLSNGWVKINYKSGYGYVSNVKGAYLETVNNTTPSTSNKTQMIVKVDDLNVRKGEGTKHAVIGKLKKGDTVTVVSNLSSGWVKIEYNGGYGYVSNVKGAYLDKATTTTPDTNPSNPTTPSQPETENKKEMVVKVDELNIRNGAGTKHTLLGKLVEGDKVTVLEELSNGWVKIKFGSITGYVSNVKGAYLDEVKIDENKVAADEVIALINNLNTTISLSDREQVAQVEKAYNSLNDKAKALVTNIDVLNNAISEIERLDTLKDEIISTNTDVKSVVDAIEHLPEVTSLTIDNKDEVMALWNDYNLLDASVRFAVEKAPIIRESFDKIESLMADEVIALINALPSVDSISLGDKVQVQAVRAKYEEISTLNNHLVTNISKLVELEVKLMELENVDKKVIDIILEIEKLDTVITFANLDATRAQIEVIEALFEQIEISQYELITNLTFYEDILTEVSILERVEYVTTASDVEELIDKLPSSINSVTWGHGDTIRDILNAIDKIGVAEASNISSDKQSKFEASKSEWERVDNDLNTALSAIHNIPEIDSLTDADRQLVIDARIAYDNLDEKTLYYFNKLQGSNGYNKLVSAENKLGITN